MPGGFNIVRPVERDGDGFFCGCNEDFSKYFPNSPASPAELRARKRGSPDDCGSYVTV